MRQPIDWSGGWAHIGGRPPKPGQIEFRGTFKNATFKTDVLRIEVECDGAICEKSIQLGPGGDLRGLLSQLQQHKNQPFNIVQQMINTAWKSQN